MSTNSPSSVRVGFVGLGSMGAAMAANLLRAGFALTAFDVSREAIERVAALGAVPAQSVTELAHRSDVLVVAVVDDAQVRDVCLAEGGALAGLSAGSVLVITSTIAPATHKLIARRAAAHGVVVMDAAMTGGSVGARDGSLTFFVGGPAHVLARITPVLDAMSRQIFHCGDVGAGAAVKIINNFLSIAHILAAREALQLAAAAKIDPERLLTMINAGELGSSWATRNWERLRHQEATHSTGAAGYVAITKKDLDLVADFARAAGVGAPIVRGLLADVAPTLEVTGLTGLTGDGGAADTGRSSTPPAGTRG
ncbi:MAG: NAD(P)-dependent oxidoreductase [Microbacteriaceae bacterium]